MAARVALGLAGVAAAAAASIAVLAVETPAPDAGERLLKRAGEATGLSVEAAGPAEFALFPTPRLRVMGVRLSRPGEPAFAVAREMTGTLRLGALLRGGIELGGITLDAADIALDRAPLSACLDAFKASGVPAELPSIRLVDSRLSWRGHSVDRVEAGLVWPHGGGPLAFSGVGRVKGRQAEATVQLGDLPALARGESAGFRAKFSGGGVRVTFDGDAINRAGLRFTGDVAARTESLGDAVAWLDLTSDGVIDAGWGVSIAGKAALDSTGLDVSGAELDLAGDSFLGAGRVTSSASGEPMLEATLDADKLDLGRYLAPLAPGDGPNGGWSDAKLDLTGLKGWTLDLRLSADEVQFGRRRVGPAAVTVAVADGGLDVSVGEAAAYGGDVGGRLSLEPQHAGALMRLEGAATDVSLEDALEHGGRKAPVTGALTGDLSVEGSGASLSAIVASLSGKASLRVADGSLESIGRSRTLALAGLKDRMEMSASEAHVRIEKGVARSDDVSIVGPAAALSLAGSVSLVDGSIAMSGAVRPAKASWTLPVVVEGLASAPKLRPDLSGRRPRGEARRDAGAAETH